MTTPGISSLLWFIAIIAMIPLALWLLKRSPLGGVNTHGVVRTIASLPLSTSQRIITVEVGQGDERRWLVLGVTPHSINALHSMSPQGHMPVAVAADAAPPVSFAKLLGTLKRSATASKDNEGSR